MALDDARSGHVLLKVAEREGYREFWDRADHAFTLRAKGRRDLHVSAERGYWTTGWFYLRIPPAELKAMKPGVAYTIHPRNGNDGCVWVVEEGVRLTLSKNDVPAGKG